MSAMSAAKPVPTPAEVHRAYREELGLRERSILWSWLGFAVTFAAVRTITYSIRDNIGPFRNLSIGGEHLHHYMCSKAARVGTTLLRLGR